MKRYNFTDILFFFWKKTIVELMGLSVYKLLAHDPKWNKKKDLVSNLDSTFYIFLYREGEKKNHRRFAVLIKKKEV